ncbi:MAG TPA: PQQ-binding-like beta-propeller repeat protein [Gemmataceae bacterium]|nr:PQQ-binding-like beta-propeller repeat protein [Gemmataceae bacterium]
MVRILLVILTILSFALVAHAADWPQFLGPNRNGTSPETGLLREWPKDGPPKLWEHAAGSGWAGPVAASGKVILFHRVGDEEIVECLNAADGKQKWRFASSTAYVDRFGFDDGPRATPCIAGNNLYTLGAEGRMICLDFDSGKKVWEKDLAGEYKPRPNFFGVGTSPLVEGDRIFVNVGAKGAGIVALDRKTGKELWKATDDEASYSSPTLATIGGKKQLVFFTREGLKVLDPENGSVKHQLPWRSRNPNSVNAAAPVVSDDHIFLSACYETGAILLQVSDGGLKDIWTNDESLSNHYNTSILYKGNLFGIHGRQEYGTALRCVEWKTGKVLWSKEHFGCASLILADDLLIATVETGEIVLIEPNLKEYVEKGRFQALDKQVRATSALADGVLFVRDGKKLAACKVKK